MVRMSQTDIICKRVLVGDLMTGLERTKRMTRWTRMLIKIRTGIMVE